MAATVVAAAPRSLGGAALCLFVACSSTEEVEWTQFNGTDDSLTVEVGADVRGEGASVPLTSSTGAVDVGEGSVDAAAVSLGDIVTLRVQIFEPWYAEVERVSVRADSGERGEDEEDFERDSAGVGFWELQLEAVGDAGETRTDTFTFRLWTAVSVD
jgi:hypothetical protein